MAAVLRFLIVLLIATGTIISISFFWPFLTLHPRPEVLVKVRDFVLSTSLGSSVANVLGVTDEGSVQPINIGTIATEAVSGAVSSVREYTASALFLSAVRKLAGQYNELRPDQQEEVRELICTLPSQEVEPVPPAP